MKKTVVIVTHKKLVLKSGDLKYAETADRLRMTFPAPGKCFRTVTFCFRVTSKT